MFTEQKTSQYYMGLELAARHMPMTGCYFNDETDEFSLFPSGGCDDIVQLVYDQYPQIVYC